MSKKKVMILFYVLTLLAAATMLPRCGSGVGPAYQASANGVKF